MSKPYPNRATFWPGSSIVKSLHNAFSRIDGPSLVCSPSESVRARQQQQRAQALAKKPERCDAFGGNALKALSQKARKKLQKGGV